MSFYNDSWNEYKFTFLSPNTSSSFDLRICETRLGPEDTSTNLSSMDSQRKCPLKYTNLPKKEDSDNRIFTELKSSFGVRYYKPSFPENRGIREVGGSKGYDLGLDLLDKEYHVQFTLVEI